MSKMRFFALQELSNRKPLEVIAPSNKQIGRASCRERVSSPV